MAEQQEQQRKTGTVDDDLEKQEQHLDANLSTPHNKELGEWDPRKNDKLPDSESNCSRSSTSRIFAHRAPWLRALVLGANDGLVSIASLLLGVSAGTENERNFALSGIAGLLAGAFSMAVGEFVSVSSQRDTELAEVERERQQHMAGADAAAREQEELAQIYVQRGLTLQLARQVAAELSREGQDLVKLHAREELGIDVDALSRPWQAAAVSAVSFTVGGAVPLLSAGFVGDYRMRLVAIAVSTSVGLAAFGLIGAFLGRASPLRAGLRVTIGGWIAMLVTFGVLYSVSRSTHSDIL